LTAGVQSTESVGPTRPAEERAQQMTNEHTTQALRESAGTILSAIEAIGDTLRAALAQDFDQCVSAPRGGDIKRRGGIAIGYRARVEADGIAIGPGVKAESGMLCIDLDWLRMVSEGGQE